MVRVLPHSMFWRYSEAPPPPPPVEQVGHSAGAVPGGRMTGKYWLGVVVVVTLTVTSVPSTLGFTIVLVEGSMYGAAPPLPPLHRIFPGLAGCVGSQFGTSQGFTQTFPTAGPLAPGR